MSKNLSTALDVKLKNFFSMNTCDSSSESFKHKRAKKNSPSPEKRSPKMETGIDAISSSRKT